MDTCYDLRLATLLFSFRDLSVVVAQGIAVGDICPISHEPMEDLVPSYQPSERKMLPLNDDKLGRIRSE